MADCTCNPSTNNKSRAPGGSRFGPAGTYQPKRMCTNTAAATPDPEDAVSSVKIRIPL